MDTLSHGLWGGLLVGRASKRDFWAAFFIGMAPDLLSFGIFTGMTVLGLVSGLDWTHGTPSPNAVPVYVHQLYNVTHSFVTFFAVFILSWGLRKKPYWPLLAWPLHILLDIPTHSTSFFPTPFLWPLWGYRVDGVSWAHPIIFFTNWAALVVGYGVWWVKAKKAKLKK